MGRRIRAALVAAGLIAASPHVLAECSPEQLQAAGNSFFDSGTAAVAAEQVSAALKSIAESCPDDPYTQKVAALGFANLAARANTTNEQLLAHASEAFAAVERMHRNMPKDNRTRPIQDRAGKTLQIGFVDNYEVTKRVLNTLLVAEARAGRLAPSNIKARPGDVPINCDVYQTGLTQEVSFWVRNNQDSPGGMNIIDRRIANCVGNEYNRASIHAHRARAKLAMLKRQPGRADAAELLRSTLADIDTLKASRTNVQYDWGASDQGELTGAIWTMLTTPGSKLAVPPQQWFDARFADQELTRMSIAAVLDAAYAKDFVDAGAAAPTFPGYRAIISDAYKRLQGLPPEQQTAARASLYQAAKMHADGVWRSEANKGLKKPSDVLYTWIDPNRPPAPAAPATPPKTP